jgi:hypothetical protein
MDTDKSQIYWMGKGSKEPCSDATKNNKNSKNNTNPKIRCDVCDCEFLKYNKKIHIASEKHRMNVKANGGTDLAKEKLIELVKKLRMENIMLHLELNKLSK